MMCRERYLGREPDPRIETMRQHNHREGRGYDQSEIEGEERVSSLTTGTTNIIFVQTLHDIAGRQPNFSSLSSIMSSYTSGMFEAAVGFTEREPIIDTSIPRGAMVKTKCFDQSTLCFLTKQASNKQEGKK